MTAKDFVRRYIVRTADISEEEYYKLICEFYARKEDLIEEVNAKLERWNMEWENKYHNNGKPMAPGSFAWNVYGRYIQSKISVCAERSNKRYKSGWIQLYVANNNGTPEIHGYSKYYPGVAF